MTEVRGLAYPLQIENGRLKLAEDADLIEQSIVSALETRPFERVMRADYGLADNIFEILKPDAIDAKLSEAITEQVSGVDDLSVRGNWVNGENGEYAVEITYSVSGKPQAPLRLSLAA
jgi:hypothetical protein